MNSITIWNLSKKYCYDFSWIDEKLGENELTAKRKECFEKLDKSMDTWTDHIRSSITLLEWRIRNFDGE